MRNIDPRSKDKARKPQGIETMAINRKALFQKAHWNANWKRISGDKRAYRVIFAEMLRLAWSQAKEIEAAKRSYIVREAQRDAQNWGAPVRSFRGEKTFFGGSRYANAIGA